MTRSLTLVLALAAAPAMADETRQMDAHEHGVGALNIAFDGTKVAMEFEAPGADIVGFEYAAQSAEDRAAIDAAVATLARPLDLFVFPDAAQCSVTQASAELDSDMSRKQDDHGDHDHDDHADDHAHDDHDHDDHDHEKADADHGGHTEFHAAYRIECAAPDKITEIGFAYFDRFTNARELEVQVISASGAQAFEVDRDTPTLDLRGMF